MVRFVDDFFLHQAFRRYFVGSKKHIQVKNREYTKYTLKPRLTNRI